MSGVQLPNLPGFVSNRHKSGPKRQTLKFGANGPSVSHGPEGDQPIFFGTKNEWDPSVTKSRAREAAARSQQLKQVAAGNSELATWHPLTLRAYWRQEVSAGEFPYHIHQLLIIFYLEDGTMAVREKKTPNSGRPQGTLVKKHKVPNGNGGFIAATDLAPGSSITVYGRKFHILGVNDEFTANYLSSHGIDVSVSNQPPPSPEHEAANRYKGGGHEANREFKDYNETMLGGTRNAVRKLGDFLNFGSTPPLKFQAVWRDERMYGDLNRYTVSFYLEDRTFKIIDDVHGNEGKGPFTISLKRQKIPKEYRVDANSIGQSTTDFYDVLDLYIGNIIPVHGKQLLIVDAVSATRQFYAEQARAQPGLFKEQPPAIVLPEDEGEVAVKKQEPVPYLGGVVTFGSEESSLQSCLSLHPTKPKQDAEKVKSNQGASLKFSADLISDRPEDFGRRFVISFFLFDDTISVFEEGRKNSGIVPGKFLKRQRLRNARGKYFSTDDFYVGAKVRVNEYNFVLDGLDAFTLNYAIHHPDQFRWANLQRILEEIRARLEPEIEIGGVKLKNCRPNDLITKSIFQDFLASFLSKPELDGIVRFFYPEEVDSITHAMLKAFKELESSNLEELIAADNLASVLANAKLPPDRRATKKSIQKIRHGFANSQVSFQGIMDQRKTEHGYISNTDFVDMLNEAKYISNVPIQPHDIQALVDYFFPAGAESLNLNKLYHFLFERRSVKQTKDKRVTSTALHNSVAVRIQDKTVTQTTPTVGHALH